MKHQKGIEILGITDHGPNMPGGPHEFYFENLKVIPRELYGVTVLKGCETNIIDFKGNIDIPEYILKELDVVIASLHDVCINSGSRDENTQALLGVMNNKYVDIIGRPGNPAFPIWEEEVIKKAKEKDILIEINNGSFGRRIGSKEKCISIAKLCKEYETKIVIGSDAHICYDIGEFKEADKILKSINMPQEFIINTEKSKFINYLKLKGKVRIDKNY